MNDYQKLKNAGFSNYEEMEKNNGVNPIEVSEKYYFDMLGCLPPSKWTRGYLYDSFYICEGLTGNLHQWLIRADKKYFTLIAPKQCNHEEIVNRVRMAETV